MTYPNNPGYPVPHPSGQPGGYGVPAVPPPVVREPGPSKAPAYFTAAVLVLGLAAYLASFGPLLSISTGMGPFGGAEFTASGLSYWTIAALVAALLAAVALVVKGTRYTAIVAVAAVLGLLLVIGQLINRPIGVGVGWALWLVLLFTLLQAGAAVTVLLFEAGVITPPAPRPRYAAHGQYGYPPAGGYYTQSAAPGPQAPSYPAPYPGGYTPVGYSQPDDSSPETPPTGFPSYGGLHSAAGQAASTMIINPSPSDALGSSGSTGSGTSGSSGSTSSGSSGSTPS